jgi:tRNA-Thr(GGU) m(6)t(6)A37 methyltransferase TsaA
MEGGRRTVREATFRMRAIGVVRSPFREHNGTPIQPSFAEGAEGVIEVDPTYAPALADLVGFERIWVLYMFDRARPFEPVVVPYRDDRPRGLFATRAPGRPNPIGISALRLVGIDGTTVKVADVDILDGTPVLDLKPYVPAFDAFPGSRAGWLDEERTRRRRADRRFAPESEAESEGHGEGGPEGVDPGGER